MTTRVPTSGAAPGVVFTFPGQGAYQFPILRELYASYPQTAPAFRQADALARQFLGHGFLPLVTASSREEHDVLLAACPDLDQLGIYLSEVLFARLLIAQGFHPDLLVGHSFGDLAALAVAGVYSVGTGLEIVCRRVLALQGLDQEGRMAALSCDPARARVLLDELTPHRIEISVVNHPRQTVLSGPLNQLEALTPLANERGLTLTILKSRYPFHASLLDGAVHPFQHSLHACDFHPARLPVLLSTERRLYTPDDDVAGLLAAQFVTPLNFQAVVHDLYDEGYRVFVECGAGHIVSRLIRRNLPDADDLLVQPTALPEEGIRKGVAKVITLGAEHGLLRPGSVEQVAPLVQELSELMREMSWLMERADTLIQQWSDAQEDAIPDSIARRSEAQAKNSCDLETISLLPRPFPKETCPDVPIAIVSMGCVLPGSTNPDTYWRQVQHGISGVVDLAELDPHAGRDFIAGSVRAIVPDKTYTLLNGAIREVPYDAALLGSIYSEEQFNGLSKGQKLLALATAQSLAGLSAATDLQHANLQCILGSTADGASEYDDALFVESILALVEVLDEPTSLRRAFAEHVEALIGYRSGEAQGLVQHTMYGAVVARMLNREVATYVIDAACSSSLYAIDLGVKALRTGEADVVLAGGVFAPGPANNVLFAQFRGLTPRQSRPFDARADGVVFGDGAGVVMLKRLPDALTDGNPIHAVIRGIGLSSDGKSPSINVPQEKGQRLAVRKAYHQAHVSLDTIQYVEAHATSTPVGDAVEFASLRQAMQDRDAALPSVVLGSVKALVGHTGWVSGVASVIKLCKAFGAAEMPQQYHYEAPNPKVDLDGSPFAVVRAARPWPENVGGYPRRAGINAFGFGGTNAHLILEAFDEVYHRHLCGQLPDAPLSPAPLALVGIGGLFPAIDDLESDHPSAHARFDRALLRLPANKLLLPDVTDHMDASQYLAALAAEKIVSALPEGWLDANREAIGVVLGLTSKTERGVRANERIFLDRLRRLFSKNDRPNTLSVADAERLLSKVTDAIETQVIPSGPYTLSGLMPNVAASRVASLFNLNGPNLVVDQGDHSLFQALDVAQHLLHDGNCTMVLAGGLNTVVGHEETAHEVAFLLALTSLDTARQEGLPVLAMLDLADPTSDVQTIDVDTTRSYGGAQGVLELHEALRWIRERQTPIAVRGQAGTAHAIVLTPASSVAITVSDDVGKTEGVEHAPPRQVGAPLLRGVPSAARRGVSTADEGQHNETTPLKSSTAKPVHVQEVHPATHAYVQATPIYTFTPDLFPEPADSPAVSLNERRILFLTDQPASWAALEQSGALDALTYSVACPAGMDLPDALPIDLTSDASVAATIQALHHASFDTLIAVKDLKGYTQKSLLLNDFEAERALLDLLFVACRHVYARIRQGEVAVVTVCLQAYMHRQLDPYTGLMAGFLKSLAREASEATCCIVHTDEDDGRRALRQVEVELGQPGCGAEVGYRDGQRHRMTLRRVEDLARADQPFLDADSVVLATGGGRGVTAVLAEELLQRFGCTVVALGRTDPAGAPEAVRAMDEEAFERYEAQFYRDEFARDGTQGIKTLKQQYAHYQAVLELNRVIRRLHALPGTFDYRRVDINDAEAVERLVASIYQHYGRIDLVLHGAGIQDSRALPKKSLEGFRKVVFTKLGSLRHLYRACTTHRKDAPLHVHLLTSAFSYLGNDGQPDYGAANETLNRLAAGMNAVEPAAHWSSMAWLGWAGIGMTRRSEYAALAARRRLRGVTKQEGQALFSRLLDGPPTAAVNVLLADGEIQYYQPAIASPNRNNSDSPPVQEGIQGWSMKTPETHPNASVFRKAGDQPPRPVDTPPVQEGNLVDASERPFAETLAASRRDAQVTMLDLSIDNAAFLQDHEVHGVPTLPGAFLIGIVAEAAQKMRPELKVVAFENTRFLKFVKVYPRRGIHLRLDARVVHEGEDGTLVRVQVLSDFHHKSGLLLQKDIVQTEVFVRMARESARPSPGAFHLNGLAGLSLPDPYVMDGSAIRLGGSFDSMQELMVGEQFRKAGYQLAASDGPPSPYQYLLPSVVMVDALWRFGTVQPQPNRSLSVYVPVQCQAMKVYFDYTDFDLATLTKPFVFQGANPREEGDLLRVGPIEAYDEAGTLMLRTEGGLCRKVGVIPNAF